MADAVSGCETLGFLKGKAPERLVLDQFDKGIQTLAKQQLDDHIKQNNIISVMAQRIPISGKSSTLLAIAQRFLILDKGST